MRSGSDKISTASPPTAPDKRTVALVRNLVEEHGKLPVFAVDGRGDLISWNGPTREWYTDFGRRAGNDRNFLWWLLTAEEARVRIADWAAYARDQVALATSLLAASIAVGDVRRGFSIKRVAYAVGVGLK